MTSADDYSASFATALDFHAAIDARTMQRELGVSDIGHCHSRALFKLTDVEPTDAPSSRQASHGKALHALYGAARKAANPHLLIEQHVKITLPSGIVIPGTADEIDPTEPSVTDLKTVGDEGDMAALRRTGSDEQQRFQRHLYYYGAYQAGLAPAEGIVRNVWVDRAGHTEKPYVEQEPFDYGVVLAADSWLQDVLYAREHGEDVPRGKHHYWCRSFCQFFTVCRGALTHPDLEITDPEMVRAVELVYAGRAAGKEGKGLEESGRRVLAVLQASVDEDVSAFLIGDYRARWSKVNTDRGGHWKLSVDLRETA